HEEAPPDRDARRAGRLRRPARAPAVPRLRAPRARAPRPPLRALPRAEALLRRGAPRFSSRERHEGGAPGASLRLGNPSRGKGDPLTKEIPKAQILRNKEMSWAQLAGVDLSGSDFYGTKLMHASFKGSRLVGVNFTAANLRDADLTGADLTNAVFRD